jgi:WD repeat-containing protein 35
VLLTCKASHLIAQLYSSDFSAALKTAMRLTEYDDLLDPRQAYSILALAALAARSYGICSKAFIKLESLSGLTDKLRQAYEDLALQIFTKYVDVFQCNYFVLIERSQKLRC